MRRRYGWGLVAVLVLAALVGLGYPANAVTLVTIHGHVTDKLGNPLSGVAVTDGNKTVYTDGGGNYSLPEDNLNDQVLSLSRTGLERIQALRVTAAQAATSTIESQMTYTLTLTTSPQSVNNATVSSITVQVVAHAPPASCIAWTAPGGATQTLAYISTDGAGRSTWRGTHSVAGQAEGSYSHSAIARDCGSQLVLSASAPGTYNVDTTRPSVRVLAPLPNGNTNFTAQMVILGLSDKQSQSSQNGSGVNPQSIQVTVTDDSGQEAPRTPAIAQPGSTLAKTAAMSLTRGKTYTVTATASDYAGNSATTTSRFRVLASLTTTDITQVAASIGETAASNKKAGGTLDTTDTYTWSNLKASLGSFGITVDSSLHAGDGSINVAIPTNAAVVNYTIQGIAGPPVAVVEAETTTQAQFITNQTGLLNISVGAQSNLPLTALTALVPKGADAGSVKLSLAGGHASRAWFSLCPDPWASPNCSPDPIAVIGPSFAVQFDPATLAGGHWMLTTTGGTDGASSKQIASGTVPGDGRLSLGVSPSTLRNLTTTNQVLLSATKLVSESSGYIATASVGLSPADIANGIVTDFGAPLSALVPFYATLEEAVTGRQCGASCTVAGSTPSEAPAQSPPTRDWYDTATGTDPAPGPDSGERPAVPLPSCVETHVCGQPTASATPAGPQECDSGFGYADCVVTFRDTHGIESLRGFSQKIQGASGHFTVESGASQKWQNGVRYKAGPFEINGSTTRSKTSSFVDEWKKRCDGPYGGGGGYIPAEGDNCADVTYTDRRYAHGNDTWRWEKRFRSEVGLAGQPRYTVYERNYDYSYDSGQWFGRYYTPNPPYLARPSDIRANRLGRWGPFDKGAGSTTRSLDTQVEVDNGASMSVNFPESFGYASMSSTVTNTRLDTVKNKITFRDLPFMGTWYRYDNKTDYRWEYWSCETAPNRGVQGCWLSGS